VITKARRGQEWTGNRGRGRKKGGGRLGRGDNAGGWIQHERRKVLFKNTAKSGNQTKKRLTKLSGCSGANWIVWPYNLAQVGLAS